MTCERCKKLELELAELKATLRGETGPSPGDCFNVRDVFSRLKEVVPGNRRPGHAAINAAIATKVSGGADPEHIISRAEAYYQTPHSRGLWGWALKAFIRDGHYDDDDDAWQDRKPTPDTGSTPVYDESAAVKRRAQDADVMKQQADDPGALARAVAEYKEQRTATTAEEQTDE